MFENVDDGDRGIKFPISSHIHDRVASERSDIVFSGRISNFFDSFCYWTGHFKLRDRSIRSCSTALLLSNLQDIFQSFLKLPFQRTKFTKPHNRPCMTSFETLAVNQFF